MALLRCETPSIGNKVLRSVFVLIIIAIKILSGFCYSLESTPAHFNGVLSVCRDEVVSLICHHNNLNSGATRWMVGPPVNCAVTVFHNSAGHQPCGPFIFQDSSQMSQLNIKSIGSVKANTSIDGVFVGCRDNPGNPSTLIGNITICVIDEIPSPGNVTIMVSNMTVMNISWDSSPSGSCRFTFYVTINSIDGDIIGSNETYETFVVFFNLQSKEYIVSVTTRVGSCASNPVVKTFTLSVNHFKGNGLPLWIIPFVVIVIAVTTVLVILIAIVIVVFVKMKSYRKLDYGNAKVQPTNMESSFQELGQLESKEQERNIPTTEITTKESKGSVSTVRASCLEGNSQHHQDNIPKVPERITPCGEISSESFDHLMRTIQDFQYNLQYDQLAKLTGSLTMGSDTDLRIMGMLTETTGCTFRNDFDKGIELTEQALELCKSSMNVMILRCRIWYVKSSLYRNHGDDKLAREFLEYAVQESDGIASVFDSSIVAYQQACVYIEDSKVEQAKKWFRKAIVDSRSLNDAYLPIIQQKASIGLALAYLGCSKYAHMDFDDHTSDEDIKKAKSLLSTTNTKAMPKRTEVEFLIANSILFLKQKEISKAIEKVEAATEICADRKLEGKMEITSKKLLEHLRQQ